MAKTFISLKQHAVLFAAVLIFSNGATADAAQRPQAGSAPIDATRCTQLARDLDELSKSLAMNAAQGIGERNIQRATRREAQYSNLLTRVRMTMDLMRDSRCEMPASIPTGEEYMSNALACRTGMLEAEIARSTSLPDSCDRSRWVPEHRR